MAGLVPAIHAVPRANAGRQRRRPCARQERTVPTWMPATSAGMTARTSLFAHPRGTRHSDFLCRGDDQPGNVGIHPLDVLLELQQHVQRLAHQLGSSASACSSTSARAQSTVSEIDGDFLQLDPAQLCTKATSSRVSRASTPGTREATIRSSSSRVGKRDVQVQAAALQRVAEVAHVVGGEEHAAAASWP